ncbi:MAG: MotA/TolQ/ExbB proton channel family protein [Kiritimatiellae bacterium]|nr:MotA/TolQ/ExbB proton channel family protein [Kiritimatiellia bacterium]
MNTIPNQAEQGITFLQAWTYGGPLMWVLAGLSVIALTLMLYLLIAHRRGALAPTAMVSDILNRISTKDLGEARRLCERRPCAFARLALAALDVMRSGCKDPALLKSAIETAGAHIAERLQGSVDYLCDFAAIAPLVGLLGTVLGMFQAFGGIANDLAAAARPVVLAQGVSQAIVTTVFGLVVAIPCLAAYAFLRRRTARRIAELESLAVELERAAE